MTAEARPAPYPPDTRAKGWRFEVDYERVRQSDTWTLAKDEGRPWLLMLWMTAWEQTPCGSLPDSDELIAARIGMPAETFARLRGVLMRGWWLCDDGRLYHDTITTRVLAMLDKRESDAVRAARRRALQQESWSNHAKVTRDAHGTPVGAIREFDTKHQAPSTRTSGEDKSPPPASPPRATKPGKHDYPDEFERTWSIYPDRPGKSKADAYKAWKARLVVGVSAGKSMDETAAQIHEGVQRYAAYCKAVGTEPGYIKQPATFFGPGDHFLSDWTAPAAPQRSTASEKHVATVAGLVGRPLTQPPGERDEFIDVETR